MCRERERERERVRREREIVCVCEESERVCVGGREKESGGKREPMHPQHPPRQPERKIVIISLGRREREGDTEGERERNYQR